MLLTRPIK